MKMNPPHGLSAFRLRNDSSDSIMYVLIFLSYRVLFGSLNPDRPTQEILAQLEKDERLEKLEETFQSVVEDYRRILALVE